MESLRGPTILGPLFFLAVLAFGTGCQFDPGPVPAPGAPVRRFLAVGDQGTGDQNQKQVAAAMKARIDAEGADFVVLLGDNFYPSGVLSVSDPQWQTKFEDLYGSWGIPVYAVLGNHDYGGGGGTDDGAGAPESAYTGTVTAAGVPTRWTMPAASYTFVRGPAAFAALDTNWIKRHPGDDGGQAAALAARFGPWAGWKIVFGHHPYRSNGTHGDAGSYDGAPGVLDNGTLFRTFFEVHLLGACDLYLAGHDHNLQVLASPGGRPRLLVSGGGGGGLYPVSGLRAAEFQARSFGFTAVDYDDRSLHYRFFDETGKLLHEGALYR